MMRKRLRLYRIFLFYATDQIHKEGIYLSVDVFGECSSEYVTAYGQYWPAISNIVDVISSMPYTDHFGRSVDTWTNAYQTVNNWAKGLVQDKKKYLHLRLLEHG